MRKNRLDTFVVMAILVIAVALANSANSFAQTTVVDPLGNTWARAGAQSVGGAGEANFYINDLAVGGVDRVRFATERYHLFSAGTSLGFKWGTGWLAKHIAVVYAMRARELWNQMDEADRAGVNAVLADAVKESTFVIDNCGAPGNSCVEDFASMFVLAAIVRNQYPEVVAVVGGQTLRDLEEKYFKITFTTSNGNFSVTREQSAIDGKWYAVAGNHGHQSAVYSAILLTQLGNAMYSYLSSGHEIPSYYRVGEYAENVRSLFAWLQTTALTDGTGFAIGCREITGNVVACNDPQFANTIPGYIPGGRVVALLYGEMAFTPGLYRFEDADPSYTGGNASAGRVYQYQQKNVRWLNVGLTATVASSSTLVAQWELPAARQMGGATEIYDVWMNNKVGTTTANSFAITPPASWTKISYGVVVKDKVGNVTGFQFGTMERHAPRRRLGPSTTSPSSSFAGDALALAR